MLIKLLVVLLLLFRYKYKQIIDESTPPTDYSHKAICVIRGASPMALKVADSSCFLGRRRTNKQKRVEISLQPFSDLGHPSPSD